MSEKKRMANLELLRCVAMMMIIVLHYLGKGELLTPLTAERFETTGVLAWVLEAFCVVAVNVYMFISGYVLCESSFKPSRLISLWLQLEFYSVLIGVLGACTGVVVNTSVDTYYYLVLLFPVSMQHYWFLTAYIYLYLLMPLIGLAVKKLNQKQLKLTLGMLLALFCVLKSILPVRLEMDKKGYDFIWYLIVFLTAAYIRKYGCKILEKKRTAGLIYLIASLLIVTEAFVLRQIYLHTGSLERMLGVSFEYNHLLVFLAALGLCGLFLKLEIAEGAFANLIRRIAPYTLGVYLLHENLGLRYSWQNWLGADRITNPVSLIFMTLLAVICVFACGIIVDMLRAVLFRVLNRGLLKLSFYSKISEKITAADAAFREEK